MGQVLSFCGTGVPSQGFMRVASGPPTKLQLQSRTNKLVKERGVMGQGGELGILEQSLSSPVNLEKCFVLCKC